MKNLSEVLNFKINTCPVLLGQPINENNLNKHDIKKAGFFQRMLLKPNHGEVIFWSKNCQLQYLEKEKVNAISPILDVKAGTSIMFGTSAYFWYVNNYLVKFVFQILQNQRMANLKLGELSSEISSLLGDPIDKTDMFITWVSENQKIVLEFPGDRQHGWIHVLKVENNSQS
jgi:hypothetical protein